MSNPLGRDMLSVLKICESKGQDVSRIIAGLTPSQSSHFVFQALSMTFSDLEHLVMFDYLVYNEHMRNGRPCKRTIITGEANFLIYGSVQTHLQLSNSSCPTTPCFFLLQTAQSHQEELS
jgi:hypothetical protein